VVLNQIQGASEPIYSAIPFLREKTPGRVVIFALGTV
jgi:hypothetical protein